MALVALALGLAGLAGALSAGLADPPPAGPLVWQVDFKHPSALAGWRWLPPRTGHMETATGALVITLPQTGTHGVALAGDRLTGDFTLEVAGAQTGGEPGIAYGAVWGWQDTANFNFAVVNANGYAQVVSVRGGQRWEVFRWAQWPHILGGAEANRVRVDVRGTYVTVRVNDETLVTAHLHNAGQVGVLARAETPGQATVAWVRLWQAR